MLVLFQEVMNSGQKTDYFVEIYYAIDRLLYGDIEIIREEEKRRRKERKKERKKGRESEILIKKGSTISDILYLGVDIYIRDVIGPFIFLFFF